MLLDVATASSTKVYLTLIGVVTPRPIGWISTVDEQGRVNLAPYSFFNAVSGRPPMVAFSAGLKRDGSKKDSHRNAELTGEFVYNVAVDALAAQINLSSKELPHGESEVDLTGLQVVPSVKVKPPRIVESPVHLECKVWKILPLGETPTSHLIIGEVLLFHVADELLDARQRIDPHKLRTLARLGGAWYSRTTDIFEMARPD